MDDAAPLVPVKIIDPSIAEIHETANPAKECSTHNYTANTHVLIKTGYPELVGGRIIEKKIDRNSWAVIHPLKQSRKSIENSFQFFAQQMLEVDSVKVGDPARAPIADDTPASYVKGINSVIRKYHKKLKLIIVVLRGSTENRIKACESSKNHGIRLGIPVIGFAGEDFDELHLNKDRAWRMIDKILNRQDRLFGGEEEKIRPKPKAKSKRKSEYELLEPPASSDKQESVRKLDVSPAATTTTAPLRRPPYRSIPYEGFADHTKVFQNLSITKK